MTQTKWPPANPGRFTPRNRRAFIRSYLCQGSQRKQQHVGLYVDMTIELVRKIAADAFGDAIDILSIIETLQAGNTPAAIAAVNTAGTDAVAECVYRALWSRLIVVVSRAYADTRPGDLHAQYAFDLLKEPDVRTEVERTGNAKALARAIEHWTKCRGDNRLSSLRAFRDKQIAHWGQMETPGPVINDIFAMSRATATAIELLAQGTGVVSLTLDSQLVGYGIKADRFWGASD